MRALVAVLAFLVCAVVDAGAFRRFNKNAEGPVLASPGSPPPPASAVFEMLTAGEPTVPGTVTFTRASESYCPGGAEDEAGEWLTTDEPCVNDLGLKMEGSRTNVLLHSAATLTGTGWSVANGLVSSNADTAPDGSTDADRFIPSSEAVEHRTLRQDVPYVPGTTYTATVYAASATVPWIGIQIFDDALGACAFNISTGTAGSCAGPHSSSASVIETVVVGGLTYHRLAMTFTAQSSANAYFLFKATKTEASALGSTGEAFNSSDYVTLWGGQVEAGAYATSYIRTSGTAVTRAAEVASISTPVAVTDSTGCAFAAIYARGPTSGQRLFGFGATNRLALGSSTTASFFDSANTTTATALSSIARRAVEAVASWTGATASVSLDGESNSGTYDGAFLGGTIYLGSDGSGNHLNGYLRNVRIDDTTNGCTPP